MRQAMLLYIKGEQFHSGSLPGFLLSYSLLLLLLQEQRGAAGGNCSGRDTYEAMYIAPGRAELNDCCAFQLLASVPVGINSSGSVQSLAMATSEQTELYCMTTYVW